MRYRERQKKSHRHSFRYYQPWSSWKLTEIDACCVSPPLVIQGHQPEMSDSVKIFLRDAKNYRFQIDFLWKSIDCRFLYQNFIDLCQLVCLLHGFLSNSKISPTKLISHWNLFTVHLWFALIPKRFELQMWDWSCLEDNLM